MKSHKPAKSSSALRQSPESKSPYRKIADFAMIGGLSALVVASLAGCDTDSPSSQNPQAPQNTQAIKQGAFVILEEQPNGKYKVLEEYQSSTTRVVVRDLQGQERILSDEEIENLLKQEEMRIDNGTSELTAQGNNASSGESGGLGLGGAILASAAGALLGSYIGNKLFNNPNYQQNKQRTYKSPQAYERSANSFKQGAQSPRAGTSATPSNAKGGFYGNSAAKSPQSSGGYGS